jgi:polyisoprenyl-phosphate glycosyltransferase
VSSDDVSRVAVVVPVYGNEPTLRPLADRLAAALDGHDWRLRLVIDASPDDSAAVARALAAGDPRIGVTELAVNVGQHRALARGLADEPDADAWVCLDADLQDPPEAVPLLLDRLARGDVGAVFAGRRGSYESAARRLTGTLHRRIAARLTGLPPDAGAFLAMGPEVRQAVVAAVAGGAPSVVLAVVRAGERTTSLPVPRDVRPEGRSAWTGRARLRQSVRSLAWAARRRG